MTSMSLSEGWPADGGPFTTADLDRMPDDGHRYELLDGMLLVSPAPSFGHQRVAFALGMTLEAACPEDLIVAAAEVRVEIGGGLRLQPDVVVVPVADVSDGPLTTAPLLVTEISSPSTVLNDLNMKKAAYERLGVRSYWVVQPEPQRPSLQAFELYEGAYRSVAHVTGSETFQATHPFAVEIIPDRLAARLPRG